MRASSDLYDEKSGALYYILHISLALYGLGFIASLALFNNATVPHGYMFGAEFGRLHSERYGGSVWTALFLSCFRFWTFIVLCFLILFRKTLCCGSQTCCTSFWYIFLLGLTLLELIAFGINWSFLQSCNTNSKGNRFNPCNDKRWCCDKRIRDAEENKCPSADPCGAPNTNLRLEQMHADPDFMWHFVVNLCCLLFALCYVLVPVIAWMRQDVAASAAAAAAGMPAVVAAADDLLFGSAIGASASSASSATRHIETAEDSLLLDGVSRRRVAPSQRDE